MKQLKYKQYFVISVVIVALLIAIAAICMGCDLDDGGNDRPSEETTAQAATSADSDGTQSTDDTPPAEEPTQSDPEESKNEEPSDESRPNGDPETAPDSAVSDPADTEGESEAPAVSPTYEEYSAMTSQEQQEFFHSFENVEDFFLWFDAAKADYEERHPGVEIGPDGIIPPED